MLLRNILLLLTIIFTQTIYAQNSWCGTDEYNQQLLQNLSSEEAAQVQARHYKIFQQTSQNSKSGTVYTIPVVVHIIHDNCEGNISKEQIDDGIAVLNEDFRRMNSDTNNTRALFKPFATDTEIEFVLAKIDPKGNCTEGIVRVNSELAGKAGNNVKALSYWSSSKYLNIWLVLNIGDGSGGGTILGYAQFPGFGSWSTFGLVVRSDQWGRIGTSRADGRTGSHEIGHCLGLFHTFQGGCGSNCSNSGDRICDTPPVSSATWNCTQTQNTCSNDAQGSGSPYTTDVVDMIENFMSYDNCQNMFTKGQASGMKAVLGQFAQLRSLVSPGNLTATGTNPGYVTKVCAPIADFCMKKTAICEGNSVIYTDRSYNGIVTGRNWSFPGGTPASSSDSVVEVTYTVTGYHDVSLTSSNASGSNTMTEKELVYVDPLDADLSHFKYDEDFENQQEFDSLWITMPDGSKTWNLSSDAAYTGVKSAKVFNYINTISDYSSDLITPSYALSAVYLPKLYFKVAYARKSIASADLLKIHYTYDCGETWNLMSIKTAGSLESVQGYRTNNWAPDGVIEWQEIEVKISSFIASKDNVRFKFEFVAGGGNNIYIDDVSITSITGVEDITDQNDILVYPNPTRDVLNIDVLSTRADVVSRSLKNVAGQTVLTHQYEGGLKNGSKETMDVSKLQAGIYFIQFVEIDGAEMVKKVIIQ